MLEQHYAHKLTSTHVLYRASHPSYNLIPRQHTAHTLLAMHNAKRTYSPTHTQTQTHTHTHSPARTHTHTHTHAHTHTRVTQGIPHPLCNLKFRQHYTNAHTRAHTHMHTHAHTRTHTHTHTHTHVCYAGHRIPHAPAVLYLPAHQRAY